MGPLIPFNESARLEALRQYQILDTPPEDRFDAIVQEAAMRFKAPIALFTLIDENRVWFKARIGVNIEETDRASSFCAHTVAIDAPLVVEDTSKHERFADNPLVVGYPRIAFYAGVPVRSLSRAPLGAFCIIDEAARTFPWPDFVVLNDFASRIEAQLEARHAESRGFVNRINH